MDRIRESIVACNLCPRLREYCARIGETRRRAYIDHTYWARPVPGFGDLRARILILGLAPGAHGANRTGRPFTGDGSGDFMYPVLHELGLASKPRAVARDDGLSLRNCWIGSVVRCAPPNGLHLLGCYHPSLRNTNTGRLDRAMFSRVFVRARELAGLP